MKPLITLVTPVYNAMPYLKEYLDCVVKQTWRPIQFIAVDDGSSDGSYEYLMQYDKTFEKAGVSAQILRITHSGQAVAVNAALPLIEGEYFTWCDADDYMTRDSLEAKAEYLIDHPELDMVRSNGLIISEGCCAPLAKKGDCYTQNIFDALFCADTYCCAGCYMMRTSLFFHCYPQKQIPISQEGQNLQLLLPPASIADCGFLPENLFHYYCRSSGHSSVKRSLTEQLQRSENFARLRKEILEYCVCDQKYYLKINEEIRSRESKQLLRSAADRAREEMCH